MNGSGRNDPQESYRLWLERHGDAAMMEGWNVFECSGSGNGQWQIQRLDDASDAPGATQLVRDEDAWTSVLFGDGEHHVAALQFVKDHNPMESKAIVSFGAGAKKGECADGHSPSQTSQSNDATGVPCSLCKWPEACEGHPICAACLPHVDVKQAGINALPTDFRRT